MSDIRTKIGLILEEYREETGKPHSAAGIIKLYDSAIDKIIAAFFLVVQATHREGEQSEFIPSPCPECGGKDPWPLATSYKIEHNSDGEAAVAPIGKERRIGKDRRA